MNFSIFLVGIGSEICLYQSEFNISNSAYLTQPKLMKGNKSDLSSIMPFKVLGGDNFFTFDTFDITDACLRKLHNKCPDIEISIILRRSSHQL